MQPENWKVFWTILLTLKSKNVRIYEMLIGMLRSNQRTMNICYTFHECRKADRFLFHICIKFNQNIFHIININRLHS